MVRGCCNLLGEPHRKEHYLCNQKLRVLSLFRRHGQRGGGAVRGAGICELRHRTQGQHDPFERASASEGFPEEEKEEVELESEGVFMLAVRKLVVSGCMKVQEATIPRALSRSEGGLCLGDACKGLTFTSPASPKRAVGPLAPSRRSAGEKPALPLCNKSKN